VKNPQASKFAEPFIDEPPAPKKETIRRDIVLKPVPRVERVAKPSFFASFGTAGGAAVLLVLFLGNLYAAYEVARFRHRSPALVCGVSIVLPFVGPLLFLAMPPSTEFSGEEQLVMEPAAAAQAAGKATTGSLAKAAPAASGLSIAQGEKPAAASAQGPQTYKRGEFTFNRRFMETKFPSFFRLVQSEADKDLVLVVRGREEYVAKRISRIASNDMHLQLLRGTEVSVPFADIMEIQVRHKDAK